jgi:purine-cytosine permease-like protein
MITMYQFLDKSILMINAWIAGICIGINISVFSNIINTIISTSVLFIMIIFNLYYYYKKNEELKLTEEFENIKHM